ncbi:hypothetical protein BXZ70DRAFT_30738 [Cristinia sonorae]|uniref:Uncharacterized protein n=1 Tax=Cristinia sonorae TaxID=1940300 RepID=A0A8K0UY73_9AGAR|nr:hypothetical protein BXZ70DRAFT_30738 [Cristinia sonorae]
MPSKAVTHSIAASYTQVAHSPINITKGHPVDLAPNSLYITTQPSDNTEFSWALVVTDETGNATRYSWSNRRPGAPCPSPNHLVVAPAGHKIDGEVILPAQVVNIQPLDPPSSVTNGRVNFAYFRVGGYFAAFCIDLDGTPCFEAVCHSVFSMSFVSARLNREAGFTSQVWVMGVLNQLESIGCVIRGEGKLVMDLENEVLEKSRTLEKGYDEDLKEYETEVVDL